MNYKQKTKEIREVMNEIDKIIYGDISWIEIQEKKWMKNYLEQIERFNWSIRIIHGVPKVKLQSFF